VLTSFVDSRKVARPPDHRSVDLGSPPRCSADISNRERDHDMRGMDCVGPVPIERDEPVFHAPWGALLAMHAIGFYGIGSLGSDARAPSATAAAGSDRENFPIRVSFRA